MRPAPRGPVPTKERAMTAFEPDMFCSEPAPSSVPPALLPDSPAHSGLVSGVHPEGLAVLALHGRQDSVLERPVLSPPARVGPRVTKVVVWFEVCGDGPEWASGVRAGRIVQETLPVQIQQEELELSLGSSMCGGHGVRNTLRPTSEE